MERILAESALRALLLGVTVGLAMWALRVRAPRLRMSAWTLVLAAALLMPLLMRWQAVEIPVARGQAKPPVPHIAVQHFTYTGGQAGFRATDWKSMLMPAYLAASALLLLRVMVGLAIAFRVWRRATPVREPWTDGVDVRETSAVAAPATFGSAILIPHNWKEWDEVKRRAVLAHEREHVRWRDFYVQLLSRLHLALFWFSPLSWVLHNRLTVLAEAASDDAALQEIQDAPSYAEVLLYFAAKPQGASVAVAMSRLQTISRRVERILGGAAVPSQTGWKRYALLAASVICAALLVSSVHARPQEPAPPPPPPPAAPTQPAEPAVEAPLPPAPPSAHHVWSWASPSNGESYVIVSGDSVTMMGSGEDAEIARSYQTRISGDYIWFRRNGRSYLISDPAVVARAKAFFRDQEELGRKQSELGERQARLGEKQAGVSVRMPALDNQVREAEVELERLMKNLNEDRMGALSRLQTLEKELQSAKDKELSQERLGELQAHIGEIQSHISNEFQSRMSELQSRMGELQAQLGELQSRAGQEQSRIGGDQARLGEEQSRLGQEQSRLGEEASRKMKSLLDETVRNGVARPAP